MYKKFNQDGRGPRRNYGDRPDFSGGNGRGKPLFSADCSNCGTYCEVPFRPTQGRPVFCRDCFKTQDQGQDRFADDRFGSDRYEARPYRKEAKPFRESSVPSAGKMTEEQFKTLNAKLDKILNILELAMQDEDVDEDMDDGDFEDANFKEVEEAPKPAPKKKPTRGQVKRAKRTGKTL